MNRNIAIFGIILLATGLIATLYSTQERKEELPFWSSWSSVEEAIEEGLYYDFVELYPEANAFNTTYPYQNIGLPLVVVSIATIVISLLIKKEVE